MTLLQEALVSISPHKFVRPPCLYYRLHETEKYDFRVDPNGIISISNFIQIRPAVLELNHADRQTDRHDQSYMRAFLCSFHTNLHLKSDIMWIQCRPKNTLTQIPQTCLYR
jgi:hypothetical protein